MKKSFCLLLMIIIFSNAFAQLNCEAYKFYGDTLKYNACVKAMEISEHYQFSKEYQSILDESLEIDPTFDYAYWAKSIAYLKSGDFITWKKLIDKAVEFNPKEYLGYRGWCRYQFFRDYEGAINDIELLSRSVNYDIGQSQNGTYHLNIAKGLSYKGLGKKEMAIEIIESQIAKNEEMNFVGVYDYLHLGVLYFETGQLENAMLMFKKQALINDLAENKFYMALTFLKLKDILEYKSNLELAKQLYEKGIRMSDPYTNPMDKVFLEDIENEIKTSYNITLEDSGRFQVN